jgi:hypothetical protein
MTVDVVLTAPSDYGFPVPSPEPALPPSFPTFTPPLYVANASAPAVAEWTRSAGPGNAVEFSLAALTADTTILFYGQSQGDPASPLTITPAVLDDNEQQTASGQIASFLLPPAGSGVATGMYLAWPQNSIGIGTPVAINRTEGWWVGPESAAAGDTVSVYGRNLTYPGTYSVGAISPLVYLVNTSDRSLTYTPTISAANPYKVDFPVTGVEPGSYEVWVHNGAGGHFGWSGPLSLTVFARSPWSCQSSGPSTFDVKTYGATGDGLADDTKAITNAITLAGTYASNANHPFATVYFPAGSYMIATGVQPPSNVCFMGAGTAGWESQIGSTGAASILRLSKTSAACTYPPPSPVQSGGAFIWANEGAGGSNNVEFLNLVLDANGNIPCVSEAQGTHVRFHSSRNVKFDHIVLNATGPTRYGTGFASFDFGNGENYYLTGSTVIGSGVVNIGMKQVFINGNLFVAADNSGGIIGNSATSETALWGNTQEDLQFFNTANPSSAIPYNYGSGSYMAAIARQNLIAAGLGPYGKGRIGGSETYETGLIYIGDNQNINAGPCDPTNTGGSYPESYPGCDSSTDTNSGEQVLFETPNVDYGGLATASSATTVSVSGLTETSCGFTPYTNCVGEDAVVAGGTGLGQNRHIVAQNGSTVTVSSPWLVNPDTTSKIYIGNVTYQVAVFGNIEQGKADQSSRYTALTGVQTWSNVFSLIYDSNQVSNVRTGIFEATLETGRPNENWIVPNYFNLFTHNTIRGAVNGVVIGDEFFGGTGDPEAVGFVGDIYRNNTIGTLEPTAPVNTGTYLVGFEFSSNSAPTGVGSTIQGIVLDGNSVVINPYNLSSVAQFGPTLAPAGLLASTGSAPILDALFNTNSFTLAPRSLSGYAGPSVGIAFGIGSSDLSAPASATPVDTCVETGTNTVSGFGTPSAGRGCTEK